MDKLSRSSMAVGWYGSKCKCLWQDRTDSSPGLMFIVEEGKRSMALGLGSFLKLEGPPLLYDFFLYLFIYFDIMIWIHNIKLE